MKEVVDKFARVFGACVIIVSLCSGCASQGTPGARPMAYQDLNYFQVDCRIAVQQRAMLMSMRQTRDEITLDQLTFWDRKGNINRQIDYNLFLLRYCS
jgi:hypothetical protein